MRKVLIVGLDVKVDSRASETTERIQALLPDHEILVLGGVTGVIEISVAETNGRD